MANPGCGCSCWALPRSSFALFLCWMAKRISGWGICVSPFAVRVCFCLFFSYDLPTYMTTGVHVDLVLTCFFSCKDRASERYRPHRRKKKSSGDLVGSVPRGVCVVVPPPYAGASLVLGRLNGMSNVGCTRHPSKK